tara:strand:+ start:154 stop:453 length:300 start_codon:yes stop_codon:yes gene_type:complete
MSLQSTTANAVLAKASDNSFITDDPEGQQDVNTYIKAQTISGSKASADRQLQSLMQRQQKGEGGRAKLQGAAPPPLTPEEQLARFIRQAIADAEETKQA